MYRECTGDQWPFLNNGDSHAFHHLQQIDGVLSIINDKNELLWYVRGKTLNSENHGQIFRTNIQQKSTNFGSKANPHGNTSNMCFQYTNGNDNDTNNNHNNNSRYGRSNKMKFDRNNNNSNNNSKNNNNYMDINGNHEPHNGMQLVKLRYFFRVYVCVCVYFPGCI